MAERLYLIHSTRGFDGCPACGQYVIWRKIGDRKYVPCDKEPVMCYQSPGAFMRVVTCKSSVRKISGMQWERKSFTLYSLMSLLAPASPTGGKNYD